MTESASQGEITYTGDPLCNCGDSFTAGYQPYCQVHGGSGNGVLMPVWPLTHEPKAQKCPVCEGEGTALLGLRARNKEKVEERCHGCEGKGWVTV